ncbi:MAG: GDP-mannose 4,6-dehydratase [Candidatus Hodarchaeales archaeon]|jgi:GDPmannose 4,6-dehydratase
MMEKIALVSGVTGQDGSYLAESLLRNDYTVVGLERRTVCEIEAKRVNISHLVENKKLILEDSDITDSSSIQRIVSHYKPNEIYNLAAQSHVGASFRAPVSTTEINLLGTLNFLEAIRNASPSTKFYQASTSEMFGDNTKCPQNENTLFSPVSPYACAKLAAHHIVGTYRKSYGIFACSGILFNHESPRRGENFVTRKITKAAARIKLGLQDELRLGNLEAQRDWGFAGDYVEAMRLMLQHDSPDDYVVATGETNSVQDFLEYVFDYAGLDVRKHVIIDSRFYRPCEVPRLWGDPSKAKRILGWEPKVSFKELAVMMYESDLNREMKK